MLLQDPILIGTLPVANRLVMPPMQTNKTDRGHVTEELAGYFSSLSEKVKAAVSVPVLLTGGVTKLSDAEALLQCGKADLIGVGRALLKDAAWGASLYEG